METKKINLIDYRGSNSSAFIGRVEGENARKELKLDSLDNEKDKEIEIIIPAGTSSINPSFFLGLFYDSIKKLKIDPFKNKYHFVFEEQDDKMKYLLNRNIEESLKYASNFLKDKSSFSFLLNKR